MLQGTASLFISQHLRSGCQLFHDLDYAALKPVHKLDIRYGRHGSRVASVELSSGDPSRVLVEKVLIDCNQRHLELMTAAHPTHCVPPICDEYVSRDRAILVVEFTARGQKGEEHARTRPRSAAPPERTMDALVSHLDWSKPCLGHPAVKWAQFELLVNVGPSHRI